MEALDNRLTFGMFVKGIGDRLKGIMAKSLSPEEKLELILQEMSKDVHQKRITARTIRAKMVALADPETKDLEPLERLRARREKLVQAGSQALKEKVEFEANGKQEEVKAKQNQLTKLTQEVKSISTSLDSMEETYDTLKESYELALENYRVAEAAYEHAKNNGSTLLFAIKAHQDALKMRDDAKSDQKKVDASFLTDLENEFAKSQRELRSDRQIDGELDANSQEIVDDQPDEEILEEFRKA